MYNAQAELRELHAERVARQERARRLQLPLSAMEQAVLAGGSSLGVEGRALPPFTADWWIGREGGGDLEDMADDPDRADRRASKYTEDSLAGEEWPSFPAKGCRGKGSARPVAGPEAPARRPPPPSDIGRLRRWGAGALEAALRAAVAMTVGLCAFGWHTAVLALLGWRGPLARVLLAAVGMCVGKPRWERGLRDHLASRRLDAAAATLGAICLGIAWHARGGGGALPGPAFTLFEQGAVVVLAYTAMYVCRSGQVSKSRTPPGLPLGASSKIGKVCS